MLSLDDAEDTKPVLIVALVSILLSTAHGRRELLGTLGSLLLSPLPLLYTTLAPSLHLSPWLLKQSVIRVELLWIKWITFF